MSKKKNKKCYYFCNGYCFWNGDTGEVCDTNNNKSEGYCPMVESDKQLEEYTQFIVKADEQKARMTADITDYCATFGDTCDHKCVECVIDTLARLGYCDPDSVVTEIATKILQEVGNKFIGRDMDNEEMYIRDRSWFKQLCENYNVECKKK